jgi:3-dehydroquinate synthase
MSDYDRVQVVLGERSYDIVVGSGLISEAGSHIAPLVRQPRVIVVTDENVAPLYLPTLERALAAAEINSESIVLPAGEQTKDFPHLIQLIEELQARGVERGVTLIALGGGVIGDIAGFAAAVHLRGIDYIQVPTTMLALVDSSVGGKTAINTKHGKNLVGAFHQPRLVIADTNVVETLPRRELLAGYAEIVKYGLINDPTFFTWLEGHGAALCDGSVEAQRKAVVTSCRAKAAIVAEDEREGSHRALLNLGHTFGHALEVETGFSDMMLHGETVAVGTVMAFELSVAMGLCPAEDAARVRRHLAAVGLPTSLEPFQGITWDPARLAEHMTSDKKVKDGRNVFVLVRGIGEAFLSAEVKRNDLLTVIEGAITE